MTIVLYILFSSMIANAPKDCFTYFPFSMQHIKECAKKLALFIYLFFNKNNIRLDVAFWQKKKGMKPFLKMPKFSLSCRLGG